MSQPKNSANLKYSPSATTALLVIGLLILVPSGLCTGLFGGAALVDMLSQPRGEDYAPGILLTALIVGAPFIVIGATLLWFAIKRMRANARGHQS